MNSADMVVVSGAGTGIGWAVARRLTGAGFRVLAVGRRREPLDRLAKELAPHLDVASADLATVAGATAVAGAVRAAECRCAGVVAAAAHTGRSRPRCTASPTTSPVNSVRTAAPPTWSRPGSFPAPSSGRAG